MPLYTEGIDYMNTASQSTDNCFYSNGKRFVCRYYDNSGGSSAKILDAAEASQLHTAGLLIHTVYETCAGSSCCNCPPGVSYFTGSQGTYDGGQAKAAAQRAGQPSWAPIYFAVDYDASTSDLQNSIVHYFNGVYGAVGGAYPIGVYGSFRVVEFANANWPGVPYKWQTYAWSGGNVSEAAILYQYLNGQYLCSTNVDLDHEYWGSGW